MHRPPILIGLAAIVLASSCNKSGVLKNERADVEAKIQHISEEMRSIDAKFDALQTAPVSDGTDLSDEEAVKKNAALSKKCAEAEAALSELRPRVETYKAKYPN